MPKALIDFLGYSFFFWANENNEPPHIHVCKGNPTHNATKFWITPNGVELEHNKSQIPQHDLNKIARYISQNRARIITSWYDFFGNI